MSECQGVCVAVRRYWQDARDPGPGLGIRTPVKAGFWPPDMTV